MNAADGITILEHGRATRNYWRDFWGHRELLVFLIWRDIIVRYKQTVVGTSWLLIRPFLTMLVFTFVFGRVAGLDNGGAPYPLIVFTGLLPWLFFASALSECSNSLVGNSHLISKIYFPRLIVPIATVAVSVFDFMIMFALLFVVMLWYRFLPGWQILTMPLFVLLVIMIAFGMGLWTAALNVRFRDFRHLIPFLLQLGVYVSPVGYSSLALPERWRMIFALNPLVGVLDGFRWSILGGDFTIYWPAMIVSVLSACVLLLSGVWYFRRTEATFADVI